ncbi:putative Mir domain superfamily protein [Helianthus anomalus]
MFPMSGTYLVSCFGDDGNSDTGDYWRIEIEGSEKIWRQDQRIRLRHVDTNGYLHSHNKKYNRIAGGQQEVRNIRSIYKIILLLREKIMKTVIKFHYCSKLVFFFLIIKTTQV